MKIWQVRSDNKSMEIVIKDYEKYLDILDFDGRTLKDIWKPIEVLVDKKSGYKDYPYFISSIPVFTDKTLEILGPLIIGNVEVLPVKNNENNFYLINVIEIIDALNYEKSKIDFRSDGKAGKLYKIVFNEDLIRDHHIFKLPESKRAQVYVSDTFRDIVIQEKLEGFVFDLIWDSEELEDKEEISRKNYELMLMEIERKKGAEYTWDEAYTMVESGKTMASGRWKIQNDIHGGLLLGKLTIFGEYQWISPIYIPPVLLDYKWHEVEKSEI